MDDYTDALLRSLKINGREYSDILIKGPETLAVGRLVLDPFSATVYSSSPAIYAAIEALVARGLSMDEAIERRSEEHTSELQSLMRNSYAVFCLKKKKNQISTDHNK